MLSSSHRALFVIVLVLPFLGQGIPYPGGVPLFLPFAMLLLPATLLLAVADRGVSGLQLGDATFNLICILIVISYVYGIVLSTDFPGVYLFRETTTGLVAIAVAFTVANSDWDERQRRQLVRVVAWVLLLIGAFVAIIGAWKFYLFVTRGEVLGFILAASSGGYPWGTSLVSDYNFYALTILAAILSALYLADGRPAVVQIALALLVAGLIVVGFLAGSRRFWVAAPLFVIAQLAWMMHRSGARRLLPLSATFLAVLLAVPVVLGRFTDASLADVMTSGWDLQLRLRTLLDAESGLGSRFELWQSAAHRLSGATPWVGSGFDYMRWFSCEFGDCSGAGYPHMPVLSAYLYGGVIAAALTLALYIYTVVAGLRLAADGSAGAWLIFPLLATFVFAAISSNGPFSIRAHVLLGALCVGLWHVERSRYQAA